MNRLYDAYRLSKKNSDWKTEVQKYETNWLSELSELKKELDSKTYRTKKGSDFIINERGKIRHIVGSTMRDRIVRHSLCDNVLAPAVSKYLIYDNGASQKGKGISFSRDRLLKHLRNYYHHFGNEGYILLMDFSKYYDNILHDEVRKMFHLKISKDAEWLLDMIIKDFEVDMSEYPNIVSDNIKSYKYSSLEYVKSNKKERMMKKSVNIGDQTSQIIGVYYPTKIDNYVKIVRSKKYYGRYMDDCYCISDSKDELKSILKGIHNEAEKLGIFINEKKTKIVKLSDGFRYLQNWYVITDTGKVVVKINPKRLVTMRRKLKKLHKKALKNEISYDIIRELFSSWINNYYKIMSRKQRSNLIELYKSIMKEENDEQKSQNHS